MLQIDLVVDVGSGQGYISLAVAMLSGVEVIGIDNQAHNGEVHISSIVIRTLTLTLSLTLSEGSPE